MTSAAFRKHRFRFHDGAPRHFVSLHQGVQHFTGFQSGFIQRPLHRCQNRECAARIECVVKAGHDHIVRDTDPVGLKFVHCGQRHTVIGTYKRIRQTHSRAQESVDCLDSVITAEIPFIETPLIKRKPVFGKRIAECFIPCLRLGIGIRTGNVIECLRSVLRNKMFHHLFHYGIVIDAYVVELFVITAFENDGRDTCLFYFVDNLIPYLWIGKRVGQKKCAVKRGKLHQFINTVLTFIKRAVFHHSAEGRKIGNIDCMFAGILIDPLYDLIRVFLIHSADKSRRIEYFLHVLLLPIACFCRNDDPYAKTLPFREGQSVFSVLIFRLSKHVSRRVFRALRRL